ncbi:MAG: histidine phosphatase family protein [Chloroflexota bacterium]|nr:histidine phosphatase family protein [Chloroflexota bacterium]
MELFIIRHGQSGNNALANIRDRSVDPPLTDLGERQAEMLGEYVARGENQELSRETIGNTKYELRHGLGITSLFTSPMYRSLQTVQPVSRASGLAPRIWVDIHEEGGMFLNHGGDEGLVGYPGRTRSEILAEFPDYVLPTSFDETGWWNKDHEDPASLLVRATKVSEQLREMAKTEDRVAIITHGAFMNALLNAIFGQISEGHMYYRHHNTAISRFYMDGDGRFEVLYLNSTVHLNPESIS